MKRLSIFKCVFSLLTLILSYQIFPQNRITVSGTVFEEGTREALVGVNVYLDSRTVGTSTNAYGFYSITLPAADSMELVFSSVGYQTKRLKLNQQTNHGLNVELQPALEIEEVEVYGNLPKQSSRSAQMSVMEIPVAQIKSIPALLGEKDALKVVQLMPGVQKGSEGSSGLYVRGGGPDQNLVLLDDATVYNVYHLFGFFSLFNGDAIKSIELTKGGFPARYGGRLSSVLDIHMRDGSKEQLCGEVGIGLLSSRAVIEGPIVKGKASFLVSARRTYIDALVKPFMPSDNRVGYFFYDINAKANWEINARNKVFLSGYFGKDDLSFAYADIGESGLYWNNATTTLRWNRIFSNSLFSNLSLILSSYRFNVFEQHRDGASRYTLSSRSGIQNQGLKYDFTWYPASSHTVRFGLSSIRHLFTPSVFILKDTYWGTDITDVNSVSAFESGIYAEDEFQLMGIGVINLGARLSHYLNNGTSFQRLEPRVSGSLFVGSSTSLKFSYAAMNQYLHLLTSTGTTMPTDLWVPAGSVAPPQECWQVAFGVAHDLPKFSSALSIESYYKRTDNVIAYREGASFLVIDNPESAKDYSWEENITSGAGWSYGVEMLLHRKRGRLSGWAGYTLSWTQHQFDELNKGEPFYARYDRRHDISLVGIYSISSGVTLSGTWVYGTGNAVTMPIGTMLAVEHFPPAQGSYNTQTRDTFGPRNGFRMSPFHRLDLGVQFSKKKPNYTRIWEFSVYNAYNRMNPFAYFAEFESRERKDGSTEGGIVLKQISLFPVVPSVSWSIKF